MPVAPVVAVLVVRLDLPTATLAEAPLEVGIVL